MKTKALNKAILCMLSVPILLVDLHLSAQNYGGPRAYVKNRVHYFDTIGQRDTANCVFEIYNYGTEPLILQSVSTSCGCTTTEYTKHPILMGECGRVNVEYHSSALGSFRKTIAVRTNENGNSVVVLQLDGFVKRGKRQSQ